MRNARSAGWLLALVAVLCLMPHPATAAPMPAAGPGLMQADSLPPVPGEITALVSKGWFLAIGAIGAAIFGILKLASRKVDGFSAPIKATVMFALSFVATLVTTKTGIQVPPDILHVAWGTVAAAIAAVAGMGIRALLKAFGVSTLVDKVAAAATG